MIHVLGHTLTHMNSYTNVSNHVKIFDSTFTLTSLCTSMKIGYSTYIYIWALYVSNDSITRSHAHSYEQTYRMTGWKWARSSRQRQWHKWERNEWYECPPSPCRSLLLEKASPVRMLSPHGESYDMSLIGSTSVRLFTIFNSLFSIRKNITHSNKQ